jgi:hypothetical protein
MYNELRRNRHRTQATGTTMTTVVNILGVTGGCGKWSAYHLVTAPDLPDGSPRWEAPILAQQLLTPTLMVSVRDLVA